jgi:pilus assembly protein CpaB
MRAFAISVDASTGVSGFLRSGDRVDVFWIGENLDSQGQSTGRVTKLIETNLRILATDQDAEGGGDSSRIARTVTVEVTPQQVARLAQAQATGMLSLSLVGAGDTGTAAATDVDQRSLLGIEEAKPVEVQAPDPTCGVKVKKAGEDAGETTVDCN